MYLDFEVDIVLLSFYVLLVCFHLSRNALRIKTSYKKKKAQQQKITTTIKKIMATDKNQRYYCLPHFSTHIPESLLKSFIPSGQKHPSIV